ncbi:HlyD family type I secretion periplasmic adaptor subunit [Noviherbaspirillum galbum]|uniref:Membrane fusion protein (MFP) family protein n=1 Tax=Noviherbaspirillum galbum TaxID=2709383 RepID=A0A6B3SR63_9BURK|nr:HlyD family type I secretion periplasmic adaptor subunit [Noviherbaspirillum galbum]NEX60902.1 HlyD family type I secretion periplasmic adaptor subunit [Noviherbaspirillum galbum]
MRMLFNKDGATEVVIKPADAAMVNTDATKHTRLGWWIVLAGVGGFILWAMFAPLDKGVPAPGTVMASGNRKLIQHQSGGTIEDILVKEGDKVKAGQTLVKMNDVIARSNADTARAQYITARAVESRLLAERDGKGEIAFPDELKNAKDDPRAASAMLTQQQLFSSRQMSLRSELGALDESVAGLKSQVRGLKEVLESQREQGKLVKDQLDSLRDLVKDGYVARNRVLDLERTYSQINGAVSENIGNIGRAERQIAELNLRRVQRQQDYQKEVRTQLSDTQKEAEALQSRLKALDFELNNADVKAPVDGTVVALNVFTRGGVVPPAFRMMDLLPTDDPLIVESQIPVNLIDKVHPDLPVELIFSAFNQNQTPHIPGVVTQVSADRITDERTGMPYYKMRIRVTDEGKKLLGSLQVRPGMPVEAFIKTGERTMMSYLLKPVFDRAKSSLSEE